MRWKGRRESQNVEDRRGSSGTARKVGGIGVGTIIFALIVWFMGGNPLNVISEGMASGQTQQAAPRATSAEEEALASFVKVNLADTEDVWNILFKEQLNRNYQEPNLVMFSGRASSACGLASAATGPFYCPGDDKVYIDLAFYNELTQRFGEKGDFAMSYVIAHEVAHHVQNLMGYTDYVNKHRGRVSEVEQNQLSVRLELQADFLAGVWARKAHQINNILEEGDIQEAMNAAHAIGDDRLQKQAQGYVVPDSFTHGTSEQRMRWFKKGLESGKIEDGNTFEIPYNSL